MLKRRIFLGAVCLAASLAISPVFALADETSLEGESVGEASEKTVVVDAEADKGETAPVGGGVLVDGELADGVAGQSVDGEAPAEGVGGALEGDSGAAPGEGAVPGEGATPEDAAPEDASAVADAAEEAPAATLSVAAPVRALAAAPASEPLQDGAFYRIASAIDDNYVLDITGASQNDDTNVIVYQYNRQLNQFWRAESLGGGWYRFVSSLGDNLFLGYDPAATLLSNVRTSVSTGNDIRWQVVNQGSYFELIPSMNAAMRLDLNECDASNCQNIQLYSANGTPAQRFKFILMPGMTEAAASGEHIADGLYTIESALDSTMRVDVTGCGTADGTNVELWTSNTSDAQRFMVKSVGNGMYALNSTCGNKSLDVAGGGTADGTNIQIWRPNNTIAQYWYFVKSGEGYSIRAIESQKALNVAGAASNGTNIDLSAANGSAGQRFVLASTQYIKDGL